MDNLYILISSCCVLECGPCNSRPLIDNLYNKMQMDQQWMYKADRHSTEFIDGLHHFLAVTEANQRNCFMCCPCLICQNKKDYSSARTLHSHIFTHRFMPKYICWMKHGEKGVMMEDNKE